MAGRKRSIILIAVLAACAAIFAGLFFYNQFVGIPKKSYEDAVSFYEQKNYEAAEKKFKELGSYKDSEEYLEKVTTERTYENAVKAYEEEDYEAAGKLFSQVSDYSDSADYLKQIEAAMTYQDAKEAFENEDYETAETGFSQVQDYSDSGEYIKQIDRERIYQDAYELYEQKEYTAARGLFATIPGYNDVNEIVAKMDKDLEYNDYIDRLAEYGSGAADAQMLSAALIENAAQIWENCSSQVSDEATDPYTKDSYGDFYEDPNTALTVYQWSDEFKQIKHDIISGKAIVDGQYESLKNLPGSLSECAAKAFVMQSAYSALADLSLDMSGDFSVVEEKAKEMEETFDNALDDFKLSIPEKIMLDPASAAEAFAETEAETEPVIAQTEAETSPVIAQTEAETAPVAVQTEAETAPVIVQTEAETAPVIAQTEAETAPVVAQTEV